MSKSDHGQTEEQVARNENHSPGRRVARVGLCATHFRVDVWSKNTPVWASH